MISLSFSAIIPLLTELLVETFEYLHQDSSIQLSLLIFASKQVLCFIIEVFLFIILSLMSRRHNLGSCLIFIHIH